MLVLLLLLTLLGIERAAPARAAESADAVSISGWELGNFRSSNGQIVYCLEPGGKMPSAAQHAPKTVRELPGFSATSFDPTGWSGTVSSATAGGEIIRRINYLLSTHGTTRDARAAAAVQFAVWMLRPDPGTDAWMAHHVAWAEAHGAADVVKRARALAAEATANAVPVEISAPGVLELAAESDFRSGELRYPSGTTSVRIAGARFEDGTTSRTIGDGRAGRIAWNAELHEEGWERTRTVTASGSWQVSKQEWPDSLQLHPPTVDAQQRLGAGVGPGEARRTGDLEPISLMHDERFEPVLGTRVQQSELVRNEDTFADTVSLSVAEGGKPWPWRMAGRNREYAPVRAEGVVYGPFAQAPVESAGVPPGAPIAATAELVANDGPGDYPVSVDVVPDESGYYVWVWSIHGAQQAEEVRSVGLIDPAYRFQDRFGLSDERHRVATALRWTTRLSAEGLSWDDRAFSDLVRVELKHGPWLRDGSGNRIPARIRLTAYGSEERPQREPQVPKGARKLATAIVDVTGPGEVESARLEVPHGTRGWVTVQACLRNEDQRGDAVGAFEEWCDDFGVPEETAEIAMPKVRTEAQPRGEIGSSIRDTAIVEGTVPHGAEIDFRFYLQPKVGEPKFDERWAPKRGANGDVQRWQQSELDGMGADERCLVQPVGRTAVVPVAGPGRFPSPEILARSSGVGYWVETLTVPGTSPEADRIELHRGACGLEAERTVIGGEEPPPSDRPRVSAALAKTGGAPHAWLLGGAGASVLGLGAALMLRTRSRRRTLRHGAGARVVVAGP